MSDPYNLQRFVDAQLGVYKKVCSELRQGEKRSHWMWFIFPQIQGLGSSWMSQKFSISGMAEAQAYSDHPILGARLRECTALVNRIEGRDIDEIFGGIDTTKFKSSLTLFAHATTDNQVFKDALEKYFEGQFDTATLEQL